MRRASAAMLGLVTVLVGAGCPAARFHRDRNAPGHVDVRSRPDGEVERRGERVRPRDPGERVLALMPGTLIGIGARAEDPNFLVEGSLELTLNYGENPRSHFRDSFMVLPREGYGLTLAATPMRVVGDDWDLGPLYAEVQYFEIPYGIGAGYSLDARSGDHGPQINGTMGPFYIRSRYVIGAGIEGQIGVQIKIPVVWIWSR